MLPVFNTFFYYFVGVNWGFMYPLDSISEGRPSFFKICFPHAFYFWFDRMMRKFRFFVPSGGYFMDPDRLSRSRIFAIDESIVGLYGILRGDVDFLFLLEWTSVEGVNFLQRTWMVLFISDHCINSIQILSGEPAIKIWNHFDFLVFGVGGDSTCNKF